MKTQTTTTGRAKLRPSPSFLPLLQRLAGRLALPLALLLAAATLHAQTPLNPAYTAIDLGTLGGSFSRANGINASGQVAGYAYTTDNNAFHAALFSNTPGNAGNIDLGTLGGTYSIANGINASDQIAGYAYTTGDSTQHATLFSNTPGNAGNIDLGTLGGSFSYAYAINASGQIVGEAYTTGDNAFHATLFSNTPGNAGNIDLGTLGGTNSIAYAINASGQVVGSAGTTFDIDSHATFFSNTPGNAGNIDLGTLGGNSSTAYGINASGQVVGYSQVTGDSAQHATLFSSTPGNEGNIDLGTLGGTNSYAYGINASGQVVGYSNTIGGGTNRGFLYSGGTMSNVNTLVLPGSGITNITIDSLGNAINDWGQIAAQGTVGGQSHAVLLNPVDPLTSASGASRNTKFVAGMDYDKFTATANPGGLGSIFDILDGTTGSGGAGTYGLNRDVTVTFTGGDNTGLASDIVSLTGTFDDLIVLSLTYDESLFGDNVALGWWDDGEWVLAVAGNTGPENAPTFFNRAYNPATDFVLGYYGVDADSNTAWAVINHNSDFAVLPEPGTCGLIVAGLGALLLRRKRISP